MSDDVTIPVVAEEARVFKHRADTERVSVRTVPEEEQVLLRDEVLRDTIEITRVPVDRQVAEAPPVRTDGDVTIVSVLEERLVVEKRLFVVEELHLRRRTSAERVELPATLRRTRVEIEREDLSSPGEH
jgi:stress response protein YsnF